VKPSAGAGAAASPLPNSYWVIPGKLLAGEYPAARTAAETRKRLEMLLGAGIDCFIDLTAPEERVAYREILPQGVHYVRKPIRDHGLPEDPAYMAEILTTIEHALAANRRVYLHCRAGIGRTGMVVACLLIERGLAAEDALNEANRLWQRCARAREWPSIPETDEQAGYVRGWSKPAAPRAAHPVDDRFTGALVGLAVCDALSAPTRSLEPGTFAPVEGLVGGGVDELPAGAWSDDTAMALCLAESLVEMGGFDPQDQVARYNQWKQTGHLSGIGRAVGLRPGTARALAIAGWRRQAFSGSHDPSQFDPEPLSRVGPAVMFFFESAETASRHAADAARTTCQAPIVLESCRLLAVLLHAALAGRAKRDVLGAGESLALRGPLVALADGAYRSKDASLVRAGDHVLEVLEASLWAFERTRSFAEGALLAANLGGAADVVGAVYGQLAGAHYGLASIPESWRNTLIQRDVIEALAARLSDRAAAVKI
jgi:ADP-ribosylglycohydrolase/protein-tyrosine phosphatase